MTRRNRNARLQCLTPSSKCRTTGPPMDCESIIESLGFQCKSIGIGAFRVWSPFTYGDDGEVVGAFVSKVGDMYRVTDNAEAMMHAASMGMVITKTRLRNVRQAAGDVTISEGGEIFTSVGSDRLSEGIVAVLNAALAVGHFETQVPQRQRKASNDQNTQTPGSNALRQATDL